MKGLLLKDCYLAWAHFKGYLCIVLGYSMFSALDAGGFFLVFYPCMLSGMIPVNLMAYDERSGWDKYTALLPFTRAQIVASKYIIGIVMQTVILAIVSGVNLVRMAVAGGVDWAYLFGLMGTMVMLSAISTATPLPFIFRMGVEKGRMGYYMMIVLAGVGSFVAGGFFDNEISPDMLPELAVPVMILIGICVYAISWRMSLRFYEKREL